MILAFCIAMISADCSSGKCVKTERPVAAIVERIKNKNTHRAKLFHRQK